jgi:DNA processing protein
MPQGVQHGRSAEIGEEELHIWLQLLQIPHFGVASLSRLLKTCNNNLAACFALSPSHLKELGFKAEQIAAIQQPNHKYIDASLKWLHSAPENFILSLHDPRYPSLLHEIARPPMVLFGRGDITCLSRPQIAIVGSRNPTVMGQENARWFASELVKCGWLINSGLALGVDGLAHRGALEAQGQTIAVLGTGIEQVYPRRHKRLADDILQQGGCLVSEFEPGMPARSENFPRRNRIISGLSLGTLVIEAAQKSGSLITARFALEQNREVFAVPGNIHSPLAQGCNYLIKQGAKLVESVEDINEEFQNLNQYQCEGVKKNLQKSATESLAIDRLLDSVDFEVTLIDVVAQRSGKSMTEVMAKLLEYELRGLVASVPGGYIKLRGK